MTTSPGALMRAEIAEQPDCFARIVASAATPIREIAAAIAARRPRFVTFVARGTSDNAALYAKYLVEVLLELPAGLVSPSTLTAYKSTPAMADVLFIGVSQSGASPDLVDSMTVARRCGATTVAFTNASDSPLARAAEFDIDVLAGPELAVAATKTYTAEMLAMYMFVEAVRGGDASKAAGLPEFAAATLERGGEVAEIAARYRFAQQLVTTARGYSYATAKESALKLMETCYLAAQAFSGADLLHGPMAMIDQACPVIAVVPDGVGGRAMSPVIEKLHAANADLFVVGSAQSIAAGAVGIELPTGCPDELSPLIEIIPLQQLACEVALLRGGNPDAPRGLNKVTETL